MPNPAPLPDGLPVAPPFFLRQFRAPDAWGEPGTPVEERVEQAVTRGFIVTDPEQSLFLVRDGDDLRRVVVGMTAGRQKPAKNPFHYVPFTPAELDAAGIVPEHVAEDRTGCYVTSRVLHHDARTDEAALRALCDSAMRANRPRVDVFPVALKVLYATAAAEGCPACPVGGKPAPPPCRAPDCLALPVPPPPEPT